MTQINAYLHFDGNCREAMTFYKECLGGELALQSVEGSPVADQVPAEAWGDILHSSLTTDAFVLLASDMTQTPIVRGNSVSLCIDCSSEEEINRLFSHLSAGGEVTCPLGRQFWGATFAALTDKYGTNWLLNYDQSPKA